MTGLEIAYILHILILIGSGMVVLSSCKRSETLYNFLTVFFFSLWLWNMMWLVARLVIHSPYLLGQ